VRKLILAPVVACWIAATSQGAQILLNPDFENATHGANWTVNSPITVKQYSNSFWSPGNVPTGNGDWGLEMTNNGTMSQNNAQQSVTLTPGMYELSASVWANVYDNGTTTSQFSRARFSLRVNGTAGTDAVETVDLVNNGTGAWTGWTNLQTQTYTMQVNTTVTAFLQMIADGRDGSWGQVVADEFRLNATLIPEPATLLMLAAAMIPLALLRRERLPVVP